MTNNYEDIETLSKKKEDCEVSGFQEATVCVPVTVKPCAEICKTKIRCIGCPKIDRKCCDDHSHGGRPDYDHKNGTCTFTITQKICVEVPVKFKADADIGMPIVDCGKADDKDCCKRKDDYYEDDK